jgi:glutathione S-transferase
MVRLVSIRYSHYCDKARWALEHGRIPYREEPHLPLFAWRPALRAGKRRTVPSLIIAGAALPDSTDILRWVDRQHTAEPLFPPEHEAEISALEEEFDLKLGPATRRIVYSHLLRAPAAMAELFSMGAPRWELALARVLRPAMGRVIKVGLKIDDAGIARSQTVVDRTFASVEARLADGRRHLVGDRLTAADIAFATLAAPILLPPGYLRHVIAWESIPAELQRVVEKHRATPAGRFALRLYEERAKAA